MAINQGEAHGTEVPVPPALQSAIGDVERAPTSDEAWDTLLDLAAELQRPDEVAALFERLLDRDRDREAPPSSEGFDFAESESGEPSEREPLSVETVLAVGQRAVGFYDEWYEDSAPLVVVLSNVLAVAPGAEWAFHRLSLLHTRSERWDELLGLYDGALVHEKEPSRKNQLLDEAAKIARDFANDADRAIGYLASLAEAKPKDAKIAAALERLYEKQSRHADLAALWTRRLPATPEDAVPAHRAKLATLYLDRLNDAANALAIGAPLLDNAEHATLAEALLSRIVAGEDFGTSIRVKAVHLLRKTFAGRPAELSKVLPFAIHLLEGEERVVAHREAADALCTLGRDGEAVTHLGALVVAHPDDDDTREELLTVATRTDNLGTYAAVLAEAAEAASSPERRSDLRLLAAAVHEELSEHGEGHDDAARELRRAVLADEETPAEARLQAGRALVRTLTPLGATDAHAAERLDVISQLAELTTSSEERRELLGALGRGARESDPARALAAYQTRLREDEGDREALGASIELYAELGEWDSYVLALQTRVKNPLNDEELRADLHAIARASEERLDAPDDAIAAWKEAETRFGEHPQATAGLARLFEATGRFRELTTMLQDGFERATSDEQRAEVRHLLGEVHRRRLNEPNKASVLYAEALTLLPSHTGAQAGMRALLDVDDTRTAAVNALADAYEATGDWQGKLEILKPRLEVATTDRVRAAVLAEAAMLFDERAEQPDAALSAARRALALPDGDPALLASLRDREAYLLEKRLDDSAGALEAYRALLAEDPERLSVAAAVARNALRCGDAAVAAETLIATSATRGEVEAEMVEAVAAGAASAGLWAELADALRTGLASGQPALPARVGHDLALQLATWYADNTGDVQAAEAALFTAANYLPTSVLALTRLVDARREEGGTKLADALVRLAEAARVEGDVVTELGSRREAAELAKGLDDDRAKTLLDALAVRVAAVWAEGADVAELAQWLTEERAELAMAAEAPEEAVAALVWADAQPFEAEQRRGFRHRAAALAAEHGGAGGLAKAIRLYEQSLNDQPEDDEAREALAALYEQANDAPKLLTLRRNELALDSSVGRRDALRLAIAALQAKTGDPEAAELTLSQNLLESPGHGPTIDALTELLLGQNKARDLIGTLSAQARARSTQEDEWTAEESTLTAAQLWLRAAAAAEEYLTSSEALSAFKEAAELEREPSTLDAIARLLTARGEHREAIQWLTELAELVAPNEKPSVVVRLSRARASSGEVEIAKQVLESALEAEPGQAELRSELAELYRNTGAWESFTRLTLDAARDSDDLDVRVGGIRAAAEAYVEKLQQPAMAIPLLEEALEARPNDRVTRSALADALRASGRTEDAKALLATMLEEFGRRRPPERALVHYQLARVARQEGRVEETLAQLDLASSMDVSHAGILRELGEVARTAGELERAERAYRSLLLVVRRHEGSEARRGLPGASEVSLDLAGLAEEMGDSERATELLESAFEAAAESQSEARGFEARLRTEQRHDLLRRSLLARLGRTEGATRAEVLSDLAGLLEGPLADVPAALRARLEALILAPERGPIVEAAEALARKEGQLRSFTDALARAAERLGGLGGQAAAATDLYLRAATTLANDVGEPAAAVELLHAARRLEVKKLAVLRRLEEAYEALNHGAGRAAVLGTIAEVAESGEEITEALYLRAKLLLADDETRNEGVTALEQARRRELRQEATIDLLREAAEDDPEHEGVLRLLERVARDGDSKIDLLDALERRGQSSSATLTLLREAWELAKELDEIPRGESLLRRAVELAQSSEGGLPLALWAPMALAERRKEVGDAKGALGWFRAAAEASDGETARRLWLEAANLALDPLKELVLASEILERLREDDPGDRAVWEPLLAVFRAQGDRARLEAFLSATSLVATTPADRNRLRLERARLCLDAGNEHEAVGVLREILEDDPSDAPSADLLYELYQKGHREEDALELSYTQLEAAKSRRDSDRIVALALRIGGLLTAERREDAVTVYQGALEAAGDDAALLSALLGCLDTDEMPAMRGDLMGRLLALTTGPDAVKLAHELASLWRDAGDNAAAERALTTGFERAPGDVSLRKALESLYTASGDNEKLASLIVRDAAAISDPTEAVARYREAATLYRERLNQPTQAADVLRSALLRSPGDEGVLGELSYCLAAANEHGAAVEELSRAIEAKNDEDVTAAPLLRLRAQLLLALSDDAPAVADLERAYALAPKTVTDDLAAALDYRRQLAAHRGDVGVEREVTLRLAEIWSKHAKQDAARDVLVSWTERFPGDADALRLLADLAEKTEGWGAAAEALIALVRTLEGEPRAEAALRLLPAAEKAERIELAREGLELALASTPEDPRLKAAVRDIYEKMGAFREVATMLLADAETAEEAEKHEALRRAGELLLTGAGDAVSAVGPLEQALSLKSGDHDTTILLADAYTGAQRLEEATALLDGAISSQKGRRGKELAALQHRMARVAYPSGAWDVALAWLNAGLDADMQNGQVASELADLATNMQQYEVALKALRAITLMKTPGPMSKALAYLRQGQIAHYQGDQRKASLMAKKAQAEDPNLEEATQFLQALGG
jgi:thioredoxin-like negative regulator of GroEL